LPTVGQADDCIVSASPARYSVVALVCFHTSPINVSVIFIEKVKCFQ
jgi:hypothetical protein